MYISRKRWNALRRRVEKLEKGLQAISDSEESNVDVLLAGRKLDFDPVDRARKILSLYDESRSHISR